VRGYIVRVLYWCSLGLVSFWPLFFCYFAYLLWTEPKPQQMSDIQSMLHGELHKMLFLMFFCGLLFCLEALFFFWFGRDESSYLSTLPLEEI
jgi:lipopolysaccharide export LptBFGC system permease protein LptF